MLSEKGKYASATQNRRFVWSEIVWPLILNLNDVSFTLEQFQYKQDIVCQRKNIPITVVARGLASLQQKGIILKEGNLYSIHYKLIPYMRVRVNCDYATVIHEVRQK